jgi:D-3-phosphoglycerate dehydrogenase
MNTRIHPPRLAVAEGSFARIDALREQFSPHAEIRVGPLGTPESAAELTAGADALVVTLHPLRAAHIAALPDSVKVIVRAGVGLDTIDLAAARDRGIAVAYQPTYATAEVADHAATLALTAWRRIHAADAAVRDTGWAPASAIGPVHSLEESVLGVLGTGRIGRALIARLSPFVSRVVAFDAVPDPALAGVEWADSPEQVFEQADLVSLHLPLTEETRHIVDAAMIARMPRDAVLVNVSRGGLVDEHALADALHAGRIGGAALDVFEDEPLAAGSPLRGAPHTVFTPHIAWYSEESGQRLAVWSISDAIAFATRSELDHGALA